MVVAPVRVERAELLEARAYGLLAEFDSAEQLLTAARRAYAAGYRSMDAYSPFPIEGLAEALGSHTRAVPLIALGAGILGALGGLWLQLWIHTSALPINVGGRPLASWPSFVPVTFELSVLFAGLAILVSLLILNGLPQPYHPVFNVEAFGRATRDRFFLCIEADDRHFSADATRRFLEQLSAREVSHVPA
jgi:Protein of unknown function (DUF3341)